MYNVQVSLSCSSPAQVVLYVCQSNNASVAYQSMYVSDLSLIALFAHAQDPFYQGVSAFAGKDDVLRDVTCFNHNHIYSESVSIFTNCTYIILAGEILVAAIEKQATINASLIFDAPTLSSLILNGSWSTLQSIDNLTFSDFHQAQGKFVVMQCRTSYERDVLYSSSDLHYPMPGWEPPASSAHRPGRVCGLRTGLRGELGSLRLCCSGRAVQCFRAVQLPLGCVLLLGPSLELAPQQLHHPASCRR